MELLTSANPDFEAGSFVKQNSAPELAKPDHSQAAHLFRTS
jgi:hypothetical protein